MSFHCGASHITIIFIIFVFISIGWAIVVVVIVGGWGILVERGMW